MLLIPYLGRQRPPAWAKWLFLLLTVCLRSMTSSHTCLGYQDSWEGHRKNKHRTGERVQQKNTHYLPEDIRSVPSAHIKWLTMACNASSRGSNNVCWSPRAPTGIHTHT